MSIHFYMSDHLGFYKDVDNVAEIQALFKQYEIEIIAKDSCHYSEIYLDIVEENSTIANLELVMERILVYLLNK